MRENNVVGKAPNTKDATAFIKNDQMHLKYSKPRYAKRMW
jgi:hypothetical protein